METAEDRALVYARQLANMRQAMEKLRSAFDEAIQEMEDMVEYVPQYLREKWEYDAAIAHANKKLDEADSYLCVTEQFDGIVRGEP